MSSSPIPVKRVASGDGIREKKRARIEEFGEEWADLLDDNDDENEDTDAVAPGEEAVVESIEANTQGFEQAPEANAKFLKAKTQAIELEKEQERLQKETSEWRSKTKALKFGTRHFVETTATIDETVEKNGGASSKEEADFLQSISDELIALTRDLNDPVYTSLVQQAFPGRAIPGLSPFRSDRKSYTEGEGHEKEDNEDEGHLLRGSSDGHEADDEDGAFSSLGHEDFEAAIGRARS
ncbi:hypothetical protein KC330_g3872 [Hortaea werneckii]|nr:hypothetical protein KC330_g3872 [Hortaea werneckii]